MTYRHLTRCAVPFLLACSVLLGACSDDPAPGPEAHYFNPSWSQNGRTVVAGYILAGSEGDANLVVRTVETREEKTLRIPDFDPRDRFLLTPDIASGNLCFFPASGISFTALDGVPAGSFNGDGSNVPPVAADFRTDAKAFVWAGTSQGQLHVAVTTYTDAPWNPTGTTTIKDTAVPGTVRDIVHTSSSSCAVYLSSGDILEYRYDGTPLSRFRVTFTNATDPWKSRLHFTARAGQPRLYAIDDSGVAALDLTTRSKTIPIAGRIVNMHVNTATGFLLFETTNRDTWILLGAGISPDRIGAQSFMGSLSFDGKSLAAVRPAPQGDSLTVFRFAL